MQRTWIGLGIAAVILLGGAYVFLSRQTYVIRVPEAQLQQTLSQRIPKQKKYLLFDLNFSNPRLDLVEGTQRVQAGVNLVLNVGRKDQPLTFTGQLDISTGLRYQAAEGQFFLTDPIIERLDIANIPEQYTSRINSVLTQALTEYLAEKPIYTLNENDTKQATAKLLLQDLEIHSEELVITLGLAPKSP